MSRLSKHQQRALQEMSDMASGVLHVSCVSPGHWLRTCKSLEARGLAEPFDDALRGHHAWKITDAGRAALAELETHDAK